MKRATVIGLSCAVGLGVLTGCMFEYSEFDFEAAEQQSEPEPEPEPQPVTGDAGATASKRELPSSASAASDE